MVKIVLTVLLVLGLTNQVLAASLEELDILNLPEWQVTRSSYGGKLLLSDSPEMVTADGILYQDQVEGNVRLFFYHVNATDTAKQIAVVLENNGSDDIHVTVHRYGLGGPGYVWMAVGKEALTSYLTGSQDYRVNIPARGIMPLSAIVSNTAVLPNMLVNGIFDFVADRPVTVKVMMLPLFADNFGFFREAEILPPDKNHLRGTFEGANRQLISLKDYDPIYDGTTVLTLADNKVDQYLEGIDATDGSKVVNYGNYGVVYQILLPSTSTGKIAYYLNPRGGDYAGAIGIKYRNVYHGPVVTPTGRIAFGDNKKIDFAPLGVFDSNESLCLTFSPPGASNLPVKLVILPQ